MPNAIIFCDNSYHKPITDIANDKIYKNYLAQDYYLTEIRPVGPHRIASDIRKLGYSCTVVNMFLSFSFDELEQLCKKFIDTTTYIVGFSAGFWEHGDLLVLERIKLVSQLARSINPSVKVIIGGPRAGYFGKKPELDIDSVFLGFSEIPFLKYFNSLVNNQRQPFSNRMFGKTKVYESIETADKDNFDFRVSQTIYDKSDFISPTESLTLETARGCIFKCKFCAFPLNGKKKLDHIKDPEVIKEELIRNYEQFGVTNYILSDDTFNDSNEKLEMLHKVFTSLPFKIHFASYLRLDLLNAHRHQIGLLKEMGLRGANLGVETFNEQAAKTIGKRLNPNRAKELLYELGSSYWGSEIKIHIGLIVGLPYDTRKSYDETLDWLSDSKNCLVDRVSFSPLHIPDVTRADHTIWKSIFTNEATKYGFYWKENELLMNWYNDSQEIKSYLEAVRLSNEFNQFVSKIHRDSYGGFFMFNNLDKTAHFQNKKTLEEQLSMNRIEYKQWFHKERAYGSSQIVHSYRQHLLGL